MFILEIHLDRKMQHLKRTLGLVFSRVLCCVFVIALLMETSFAQLPYEYAQNTYQRGRHTELAYEGWRVNDKGETVLVFGYFNHNWEEELDIPIGENNYFYPGSADRGQPTHFLPRRNRFTFDVVVRDSFGDEDELVWEVTSSNGVTRRAYGTLRADYKLDNVVIMSETGAFGEGSSTPEERANRPPSLELIGDEVRSATVGQAIEISARISDDGIPIAFDPMREAKKEIGLARLVMSDKKIRREVMLIPPPRPTVAKNNGLFLSWNVYRAPASTQAVQNSVHFEPPQIKPWEDTRPSAYSPWSFLWKPPELKEDGIVHTFVTFDEPGTYVLWGRADDGGLYRDAYITVHVKQ